MAGGASKAAGDEATESSDVTSSAPTDDAKKTGKTTKKSSRKTTTKTTTKKTTKKTTTKAAAAETGPAEGASRGYTVLARRYRSRDFGEVVGQEPIARTLQRAIEQGRTAHAYLFCGTRGVGKTSMARIFAKALNLHDADGNPLSEAGAIEASILRGEDLDVIEIDGASNRGINEARDLIAGAGLSPTRGRFKIYIIDEVHMLTREAFNALLKTMEEPPPHVKFILCTTDPQKVPATIQSRCQRFDFKAIATSRIVDHLREILGREGIDAEPDVVQTVASLGNGSMRDALSLLDRLLAGGGEQLTMAEARDVLGLPDAELLDRIVGAIIDGDPAAGLAAGAELIGGGATVEAALEMLTERLRTLMVISACGADTDLLDLTEEARSRGGEQATHFDAAGLVYMIATCDAVARNARGSATGRALFDAALVRLTLGHRFGDVQAVIAGGGEKKKQLTAEPRRPGSADAPSPAARPTRTPPPTPTQASASASVAPVVETERTKPSDDGPGWKPPARRSSAPATPPAAPARQPAAPAASAPAAPAATAASAASAARPAVDLADAWRRLEAETGGALQSVIAALRPRTIEGDRTVVLEPRAPGERAGFLARRAERLAEPLGTILGRTVQLRIEDAPGAAADAGTGAGLASAAGGIAVGPGADRRGSEGRTAADRQDASEMPLVRDAMEIFDAVVTDVAAAPAGSPNDAAADRTVKPSDVAGGDSGPVTHPDPAAS